MRRRSRGENQEYVQNLKLDGGKGEEVNRSDGSDMVLQEGTPGLRWLVAVADDALAHTGRTDFDTWFEQFAVDPVSAPTRILPAHLGNQIPNVPGDWRPFGLLVAEFPGPKWAKALPVPSDDGRRFHDDEGGSPSIPSPAQPNPEQSIWWGQSLLLHPALQNPELVPQCEFFSMESA